MTVTKHGGFTTYPLEYVALGLLMNGPNHGYVLHQDFTQAFDLIWHAEQAKFYGVLASLEDRGYLRTTTEAQDGRPPRKIYHMTDSGRSIFLAWVRQPVTSMRAMRVEFMAKLRFYSLLRLNGVEKFIDAQIVTLQAMLDEWDQSSEAPSQPQADLVQMWVWDFRRRQAIFMLEWLSACKADSRDFLLMGDIHSLSR